MSLLMYRDECDGTYKLINYGFGIYVNQVVVIFYFLVFSTGICFCNFKVEK